MAQMPRIGSAHPYKLLDTWRMKPGPRTCSRAHVENFLYVIGQPVRFVSNGDARPEAAHPLVERNAAFHPGLE